MNFDDACFGQRVKVLTGTYKDRIFMIEGPSVDMPNAVVVANNDEERYIDISCNDLELLSPTLGERLDAEQATRTDISGAEEAWASDRRNGTLDD